MEFTNRITMNFKQGITGLLLFAAITFLPACSKTLPEIKWDFSDKDIIGEPLRKFDQIDIDIYVDATTSMEGFAGSNNSVYSQFIDQSEASALAAWKRADLKFFKFGETIKPINRAEFLSAKNTLPFYHEKGVFLRTYIDSVVRRTDAARLSVLITDLFQDEGDVNIMVDRIKEKCFSRGVSVELVGVKSDFKGKVYDVPAYPNGYSLDTRERPFYAIVFGNPYNMELLFEALKTKPFVKEEACLLISRYIIKSFTTALTKTKESKFIGKKGTSAFKNVFDFTMNKNGNEARFNLEVTLDRNKRCADFSEKNIEIVAYKKSVTDAKTAMPDSTATTDITIENIQRAGNKLTATMVLKNDDAIGNYSYAVYLKANELNGLKTPAWIQEFSTDNPVPGTPSAGKTYNLEKLTSLLLVANASVSPTYLAKFYINIFKR